MPTYTYKCKNCGTKFDKFFKVREDLDDVECPNCNSKSINRIMSASFISSSHKATTEANLPPCATGYCNTESCGFN